MIPAKFDNLCPNCEGEISSERLAIKLPCERCLPKVVQAEKLEDLVEVVWRNLTKKEKYDIVYHTISRLKDFNRFFEQVTGSKLWSAQRAWAKRVFLGKSFSIVAPTGVGKTVFGTTMALYLAKQGEKAYFVLPTTTLLLQVYERMRTFAERAGLDVKILAIHSKMKKKEREEAEEKLKRGDFDILITTSQFLARKFEVMQGLRFEFVFIDDVDAFLKSSKNIDRVLQLVGFSPEIIELAFRSILLKIRLLREQKDEIIEELEKIRRKIEEYKERNPIGQILVASATGRARGLRVKLFRELLEFEVGSTRANLRNIVNTFDKELDILVDLLKRLGTGGLVFVALDIGQERAKELTEKLKAQGIRAEFASSENAVKVLDAFAAGEIDVAVGMAAYYGVLVRGIDLPKRVRYVVFYGVPKFVFGFDLENAPPGRIAFLLDIVGDIVEDRSLRRLANLVRRGKEDAIQEAKKKLQELLQREDVVKALEQRPDVAIEERDGRKVFVIADTKTYIQASGRCSRMYAGGITKGLSVVLVDHEKAFNQLQRYMRIIYGEDFVPLHEVDLEKILREIDEDRKRVGVVKKGEDPVKTVLFVVESPNKARTIARFFGRPSVYIIGGIRGYEVALGKYILNIMATRGHMFDLVVDRGFHGVEVGNAFVPVYTTIKLCRKCGTQTTQNVCPKCGTDEYLEDAMWRVNALRLFALESDYVLIGTDPDTEGEKIAWDTYLAISPYVEKIMRAEFHEVTKSAILRALEEIREIEENRVKAQIVRRIEDRWIGFELSQKLWKVFGRKTLSAGRVQTPVLGWIIERYEEHKRSEAVFIRAKFGESVVVFETDLKKPPKKLPRVLTVEWGEKQEEEVAPPPPFTTDTMLKEATTRMRMCAREVMNLAQDLFEMGLITYHRTDSIHVSSEGIRIARDYIQEKFGEEYFEGRSWGPEGTHECIRPTRPIDPQMLLEYIREGEIQLQGFTKAHLRLYSIIFDRFVRSQMKKAKVRKVKVVYRLGEFVKEEDATAEVVFPGWMIDLPLRRPLSPGRYLVTVEAFVAPKVPLYTQADVVALMKERGIGRPSTYATIIQKLLERRYVLETPSRRKLYPTKLGIAVYNYLSSKFPKLISEERTRELEAIMDAIERGEKDYQDVLKELYEEILSVRPIV